MVCKCYGKIEGKSAGLPPWDGSPAENSQMVQHPPSSQMVQAGPAHLGESAPQEGFHSQYLLAFFFPF